MSNIESNFYDDLVTLLVATLPSIVAADVYRVARLNRANLQEKIAAGAVTPPFVTVQMGRRVKEDWWSAIMTHRIPVDVYYIFSWTDPASRPDAIGHPTSFDSASYAASVGQTLRDAIRAYAGTAFTLAGDEPVIDDSDQNPANTIIYQSNRPLYAVQVSFNPLIGDLQTAQG